MGAFLQEQEYRSTAAVDQSSADLHSAETPQWQQACTSRPRSRGCCTALCRHACDHNRSPSPLLPVPLPSPPRHVLMSDSHILAVVSRSRETQVRHHWYTTHAHCAASRLSTPSPSPSHKHTHLVLGTRTNTHTHTHTHTHDVLESRGTTNRKSHNVSEDKNGRREARAQHTHTHTHTRVRARGRRKATK